MQSVLEKFFFSIRKGINSIFIFVVFNSVFQLIFFVTFLWCMLHKLLLKTTKYLNISLQSSQLRL